MTYDTLVGTSLGLGLITLGTLPGITSLYFDRLGMSKPPLSQSFIDKSLMLTSVFSSAHVTSRIPV
jgi:hypothetical protein